MPTALAIATLALWLGLLLAWHGFWRAGPRLPLQPPEPPHWPGVAAIVPARNEAASIGACLESLLAQDYPGRLAIVVVDDSSDDGTGEIARALACRSGARPELEVVAAPPLEAGWAGKLWALDHGISRAGAGGAAEFLWLTDADIRHGPDVLRRLVAHALSLPAAEVSLMVRLSTAAPWERLLVPAFLFFFMLLYPFPAVNDPRSRIAGAAGGCLLIRRRALEAIGGLAALRDALIDDCAIARALKAGGWRIWLGLGETSESLRRYPRLGDFWRMVARSAFVQLDHSAVLLGGALAGLSLAFLAGPALLVAGLAGAPPAAAMLGALAWALMTFAYAPTIRHCRLNPAWAASLPVAAALFAAMTLDSALRYWFGRGERWKGRAYGRTQTKVNP